MNQVKEKENMCSMVLGAWFFDEKSNIDFSKSDYDTPIANILRKKIEACGIKIILPDNLLAIIEICTDGNPGVSQLILKEVLEKAKERCNGSIPEGYTIQTWDFSLTFPNSFPILEKPEIYQEYKKKWDAQKIPRKSTWSSDNACDTKEWWCSAVR